MLKYKYKNGERFSGRPCREIISGNIYGTGVFSSFQFSSQRERLLEQRRDSVWSESSRVGMYVAVLRVG
jgi:hypothetical protein